MRVLILLLLFTVSVAAEPLRVVKSRTFAPSEMVKRICVEVELTNQGSTDVEGAELVLQLTPDFRPASPGTRPPEGFMATQEMRQWIDPVGPGQRIRQMFETDFFSRNAFSTSTPSFVVENLVPGLCESVTVRYTIFIVPPPDGWK